MGLTKEQAKNRKPRRSFGSLAHAMKEWREYESVCLSLGLPVIYPSPASQRESARQGKRRRRTKLQMLQAKQFKKLPETIAE